MLTFKDIVINLANGRHAVYWPRGCWSDSTDFEVVDLSFDNLVPLERISSVSS